MFVGHLALVVIGLEVGITFEVVTVRLERSEQRIDRKLPLTVSHDAMVLMMGMVMNVRADARTARTAAHAPAPST